MSNSLNNVDATLLVQMDEWTAYPEDVQRALYRERKNGTHVVELVMQIGPPIKHLRFYTNYVIDFDDMKQYDPYTNQVHNIKFADRMDDMPIVPGKLAKVSKTQAVANKHKFSVGTKQEKNADDCAMILCRMNKTWLAFSSDIHAELQQAYCAGYSMVEFVILCDPGLGHMQYYSKYVVNFASMVQYNVHTNKSRKIRFVSKVQNDTYECAPGKLAKGASAIKTLGKAIPNKLGQEPDPAPERKQYSATKSMGSAATEPSIVSMVSAAPSVEALEDVKEETPLGRTKRRFCCF